MASLITLGEPDISLPDARGPSYALGTFRVELEEQSFRAGLEETFRVELEKQSFRAGLEEQSFRAGPEICLALARADKVGARNELEPKRIAYGYLCFMLIEGGPPAP